MVDAGLRLWICSRKASTFSVSCSALKDFLPPYVWEHRDRFFYEGMQLEIGRCFADYSPPAFYRAATAAHAGEPTVTEDGGLVDYTAGLPFPPDRFGPEAIGRKGQARRVVDESSVLGDRRLTRVGRSGGAVERRRRVVGKATADLELHAFVEEAVPVLPDVRGQEILQR